MRRSNIIDVLSGPARLLASDGTEAPNGAVLSREESQALVERVVKMSKADGIDVQIGGGYNANVRFADNQFHRGRRQRFQRGGPELVRTQTRRRHH